MTDEDDILQDEETWDFSSAEVQRAPRGRRSVVSVSFRPEELQAVAAAARAQHRPISQFIRDAVLGRIQPAASSKAYVQTGADIVDDASAMAVRRAMLVHQGLQSTPE